jgi:hypothetical protein
MQEKELNEAIDLEVSSPPLAEAQAKLEDGDELGDLKEFPVKDANLAAFKAKFGKKA